MIRTIRKDELTKKQKNIPWSYDGFPTSFFVWNSIQNYKVIIFKLSWKKPTLPTGPKSKPNPELPAKNSSAVFTRPSPTRKFPSLLWPPSQRNMATKPSNPTHRSSKESEMAKPSTPKNSLNTYHNWPTTRKGSRCQNKPSNALMHPSATRKGKSRSTSWWRNAKNWESRCRREWRRASSGSTGTTRVSWRRRTVRKCWTGDMPRKKPGSPPLPKTGVSTQAGKDDTNFNIFK